VFSRNIDKTQQHRALLEGGRRYVREWNKRAEAMTREIFMVERYSEPMNLSVARGARVERAGREFLALTKRQPGDVVDELFENERVKVLFLFKLSLFGTVLHETLGAESPAGSLIGVRPRDRIRALPGRKLEPRRA